MRCELPVGGGRWCARAGASCRCDGVARLAIVHSPTASDVRTSGLTCPDDSFLGDRLEAFLEVSMRFVFVNECEPNQLVTNTPHPGGVFHWSRKMCQYVIDGLVRSEIATHTPSNTTFEMQRRIGGVSASLRSCNRRR
jgi:hypothetical protein